MNDLDIGFRIHELELRAKTIGKMLLNGELKLLEAIRGLQQIEKELKEMKEMLDSPNAFLYKGKDEET